MKSKIGWLILSCLMALSLVLASCAPAVVEEEEVVTPVVEEEEEEPEEVVEEEEAGPVAEGPRYGGTITLARSSPFIGFDQAYTIAWQVYNMVFTHDKLMGGDWAKGSQGTKETGFGLYTFLLDTLTCHAAESWELPDKETFIYHIRPGIHFHNIPPVNGRELVADDVVAMIERNFTVPESYFVTNHPPDARPISATATDKYTVVVKVPAENQGPLFRDITAQMWPVPPEVIEQYGDLKNWRHSIGTGPFIIKDYVPGSIMTFERNPNYWMDDPLHPGNQLPYIDGFKYMIIPDISTRLAALRTGKVDTLRSLSLDDKRSLLEFTPELMVASPSNIPFIIGMRTDIPLFADIRVRRALMLALDNQEIKDDLYGGEAAILNFPLCDMADFSGGYVPLEELPREVQELYEYHPDKAKQLLAEAGYPDGFRVKLTLWSSSDWVDLAQVLKGQWAKVGVDVEIDIKEYGVYVSYRARKKHEQMIMDSAWTQSPFKMLTTETASAGNTAMISDPFIDEKAAEIRANFLNIEERDRIMREEIVPYTLGKVWYIQPPSPSVYTMWQPWLKSYGGEWCVGYTAFENWVRYVWIDRDLKEEMTGRR